MIKRNAFCLLLTLFIMLALPWCAVTLIKSDGGMAACFLLFFAVDPAFSVWIGIRAGKNMKEAWFLPLFNAGLFVLGTWMMFDMGETAFLRYAGIYLILGYLAAVVSWLAAKYQRRGN